jgi:hypothetical protein
VATEGEHLSWGLTDDIKQRWDLDHHPVDGVPGKTGEMKKSTQTDYSNLVEWG